MRTAKMQLTGFKVTSFRSVKDSGPIETSEITALIGTNESGKTNILLPLWKLNPAKEGEVKLLAQAAIGNDGWPNVISTWENLFSKLNGSGAK